MTDFKNISNDFIKSIQKYSNILIVIKGSPDPDAIASSYAMQYILSAFEISSSIISFKKVSLQQNSNMIKLLDISIDISESIKNINNFDAYIITDHQSAYVEKISEFIPCAAHIDHHEIINDGIKPDFRFIMREAGSTATIISEIISESKLMFNTNKFTLVSTALIIGIQTDTDKYDHAGRLDYKALNFLSTFSDIKLINKISNVTLSDYTFKLLDKAVENKKIYKDWLISGVGFVDEDNRDSIAITADYLLKNKEAPTVIVFAAITTKTNRLYIDASFRSTKENLNLNDIIKEITDHGGARKYKGAYQVNIEYFSHCPDKNLLWQVIESTTHQVLKEKRDGVYIIELKSIYKTIKERIANYLK